MRSARPSIGRRLRFTLIATLLVLVGTELFCRALESCLERIPSVSVNCGASDPGFYTPDPYLGVRLRPGQRGVYRSRTGEQLPYAIDSRGLRSPELGGFTSPDILFLGDSCTFGEGLSRMEDSYPDRLQRALTRRLGRPVVMAVAAVPGYSSTNVRRWMERELSVLRPKITTLWIGWNDGWWQWEDPLRRNTQVGPTRLGEVETRLSAFAAFRLLRRALAPLVRRYRVSRRASYLTRWKSSVPVPQFKENLAAIARLARDRDSTPLFMTLPCGAFTEEDVPHWLVRDTIIPDPVTLLDIHRDYNEGIREVARSEKVALIDLDRSLREVPRPELFCDLRIDVVHPSAAGQARIADLLFPPLLEILKSTSKDIRPGNRP